MLPAVSVPLALPPTVDLSSFPSARPILFISLSLFLSGSHSYIYTHTRAHTYARVNILAYTPRFSLSPLYALLFVGQRLYPTPSLECAHSSIQIYTPKCTHETTKSACGCWPRARCTFCSRGNLRLLCVVRARGRVGTLYPFQRFATTSFSVHAVEQRVIGKPRPRDHRVFFVKWKCFVELSFDNDS